MGTPSYASLSSQPSPHGTTPCATQQTDHYGTQSAQNHFFTTQTNQQSPYGSTASPCDNIMNATPAAYDNQEPSAYTNNQPQSNANQSGYNPSYASTPHQPTVPAYASQLVVDEAPASYSQPPEPAKAEEYGSSLKSLYQTLGGTQTSYVSMAPQKPVTVAVESLRLSFGTGVQAKTNEDGSVEGWLWQQKAPGHWDRLYFILDLEERQLLGFKHFPGKGEEAAPIQGLRLRTGMIVTPKFAAGYFGIRGNCFSIQVEPKSVEVVVFDTINNEDREVWVAALQKATKADEVSAWVPWEVESKVAELEQEQGLRQMQQMDQIKQQEIAKVSDPKLTETLAHSYEQEKEIETLEKEEQRLREETEELHHFKLQFEETEQTDAQTVELESSIAKRTEQLRKLEEEKQRKQKEIESMQSYAEELSRLKAEQAELLKREEERIRAEMTAQFEREAQQKRAELEQRLQQEKQERLLKANEEEKAQILQWLSDNPTWE